MGASGMGVSLPRRSGAGAPSCCPARLPARAWPHAASAPRAVRTADASRDPIEGASCVCDSRSGGAGPLTQAPSTRCLDLRSKERGNTHPSLRHADDNDAIRRPALKGKAWVSPS